MPLIMPIKDLRDTNAISDLAHKNNEPIFITKNGYSDLVIMSSEYYDRISDTSRIDNAIYEAEKEYERTGKADEASDFFDKWEKKHNVKV